MRQVLIEAARRRKSLKRGAEETVFVTVDSWQAPMTLRGSELIALDVRGMAGFAEVRAAGMACQREFRAEREHGDSP
jgi:hypothetical protein